MMNSNAILMTLIRFIVGLVLLIEVSQTASAADWRYCIAPSDDEHEVYFSGVFTTNADAWSTDDSFEQVLIQAGLRHDAVQMSKSR